MASARWVVLRPAPAGFLASAAWWIVVVFGLLAALVQLGIAVSIIAGLITAIFFMIALAGGLALGLGGQKTASETLDDLRKEVGHKK